MTCLVHRHSAVFVRFRMTDFQTDTKEVQDAKDRGRSGENVFSFSIPAAIIVAGLIVAIAIVYSKNGSPGTPNTLQPQGGSPNAQGQQPPRAAVKPGELYTDDDASLGNPDAEVVIVEFADFQCPFCGRLHKDTLPQVIDTYVKTGKALLVYKHFAFLGQESQWAAEASECARDQGKFWKYHDYLYNYLWDTYYAKGENGENVGAFSKDNLKSFAQIVGLNGGEFGQCLDSGKHTAKVQQDVQVGKANGVNGTPATFINGKLVVGAQPYSAFETAIEEALEK